jgi:starch synthase (maltosyl-transferring)
MASLPSRFPARIQIEDVTPSLDCGRYAPKRSDGELVAIEATLVRDGQARLGGTVRHRPPGADEDILVPMEHVDADRWRALVRMAGLGRHSVVVEAWVDPIATWRWELERKIAAGQEDLAGELAEGRELIRAAARRMRGAPRQAAQRAVAGMDEGLPRADRLAAATSPELDAALEEQRPRAEVTRSRPLPVDVDRERARFGSWYELFPRSFGGFAGVERRLPQLAELGFDVIYLPPVHPIGHTHRKGRNNAPVAEPGDPGSPWAIGSEEGGHAAVHPDLGTVEDFERLARSAREHGMEIALDFAIQASPDHPWLREHPEWFHRRPDGSLKYAENPPKRYQDIYNLDLACADWRAQWAALRDVVLTWVARGVRIFRVDNPHTKPVAFWEWLIEEVRGEHPDVVFLAEAFTRPAMMATLAKLGFSQSYTYFTWRNSRPELERYLTELTSDEMSGYFRPNFFVNTPDILHAVLQEGGRPAFEARAVLAATLAPSYGVYSGFEHCENVPLRPGSEEYLDSEKYEVRARELDGPLLPLLGRLNAIRREHRALQWLRPLRFLQTHNDALIAYCRGRGADAVLVSVNLDPHEAREGAVEIPWDLDLPAQFEVHDLLSGASFRWRQGPNYVRLDPAEFPAHVLGVRR